MTIMPGLSLIAIIAIAGRAAYVYCSDGKVAACGTSRKAMRSRYSAGIVMQDLINQYQPQVVITEKIAARSRKGHRARVTTKVFQTVAAENYTLDISIAVDREGETRLEHAKALARLYPDLKHVVPGPFKFYEKEPRRLAIFDAMNLAHQLLCNPSVNLAARMDELPPRDGGSDDEA